MKGACSGTLTFNPFQLSHEQQIILFCPCKLPNNAALVLVLQSPPCDLYKRLCAVWSHSPTPPDQKNIPLVREPQKRKKDQNADNEGNKLSPFQPFSSRVALRTKVGYKRKKKSGVPRPDKKVPE